MLPLMQAITDVYRNNGWTLRYIILTETAQAEFSGLIGEKFPEAQLEGGEFNAAWFSRYSGGNREAWELRLISEKPYALFETFADNAPDAEKETTRRKIEERLKEKIA